jgi:hypothetical protein
MVSGNIAPHPPPGPRTVSGKPLCRLYTLLARRFRHQLRQEPMQLAPRPKTFAFSGVGALAPPIPGKQEASSLWVE